MGAREFPQEIVRYKLPKLDAVMFRLQSIGRTSVRAFIIILLFAYMLQDGNAREAFELTFVPSSYPDGSGVSNTIQTSWSSRNIVTRAGITDSSMTALYEASENHLQCGYTYEVGVRRIGVKNNKVAYASPKDYVHCKIMCDSEAPTKHGRSLFGWGFFGL